MATQQDEASWVGICLLTRVSASGPLVTVHRPFSAAHCSAVSGQKAQRGPGSRLCGVLAQAPAARPSWAPLRTEPALLTGPGWCPVGAAREAAAERRACVHRPAGNASGRLQGSPARLQRGVRCPPPSVWRRHGWFASCTTPVIAGLGSVRLPQLLVGNEAVRVSSSGKRLSFAPFSVTSFIFSHHLLVVLWFSRHKPWRSLRVPACFASALRLRR